MYTKTSVIVNKSSAILFLVSFLYFYLFYFFFCLRNLYKHCPPNRTSSIRIHYSKISTTECVVETSLPLLVLGHIKPLDCCLSKQSPTIAHRAIDRFPYLNFYQKRIKSLKILICNGLSSSFVEKPRVFSLSPILL